MRKVLTPRLFAPLAIGLFAIIAYFVYRQATLTAEEAVLTYVNMTLTGLFWDAFFVSATELGGVMAMVIIGLGIIGLYACQYKWRRVALVALSLGGVGVLTYFLKLLFGRPRPDLWEQLVVETSFSFPSGHAMASMALALLIGYLLMESRLSKQWVYVSLGILALYVVVIGLSRLYLGVHYPSDILAGWLISVSWIATVIPIVGRIRLRQLS